MNLDFSSKVKHIVVNYTQHINFLINLKYVVKRSSLLFDKPCKPMTQRSLYSFYMCTPCTVVY